MKDLAGWSLCLQKNNEVGDGGGDHGRDGGHGHGEVVHPGEGLCSLHPAHGVLQLQHLPESKERLFQKLIIRVDILTTTIFFHVKDSCRLQCYRSSKT